VRFYDVEQRNLRLIGLDGDLIFAVEPSAQVHELAPLGAKGIRRVRLRHRLFGQLSLADRAVHNHPRRK